MNIQTLKDFQQQFNGNPRYMEALSAHFQQQLTEDIELRDYRHYIESKSYGFGEKDFVILWKLIIESMPDNFSFVECGVHRGAILALVKLLANRFHKRPEIYGISPMNGAGLGFDQDFMPDVVTLFDDFGLEKDYTIIKGYSTDVDIISRAMQVAPFDLFYLDGSHEKEDVKSDLNNYYSMIKTGGLLVVDDCNNNQKFAYNGRFWGIADVSNATDEFMMNHGHEFEYVGSIIHISLFRKK